MNDTPSDKKYVYPNPSRRSTKGMTLREYYAGLFGAAYISWNGAPTEKEARELVSMADLLITILQETERAHGVR